MKAYGHSRRDKLTCRYGCCTTKSGKDKTCRAIVDRIKRKSARRAAVRYVAQQLSSMADDAFA